MHTPTSPATGHPPKHRHPRRPSLRQRPLGIKPGAIVLLAITPVALVVTLTLVATKLLA